MDFTKLCMHNKPQLTQVVNCGCCKCLNIFKTIEIKEWTDKENDTAICPYCDTDTVIAEENDIKIDKEFLEKLKNYWF